MKTSIIGTALLLSTTGFAGQAYTPGSYQIDPMHSKVGFEVPHLVISSVEGRFNEYQGDFSLGEKFSDSRLSVTIETKSVDTAIRKRDDHLRSADFFDVAKFPKMTFKSKRIEGTPEAFTAMGDLTIKDVTKEVTLEGKYLGSVKDGYGNFKAAFSAVTKLSRKDFGLTWNSLVEAGPVVGDEVTISLKVQAAKVADKHAAK
ncbi:MAG: YceI family protein [Deltaproteobacteria bacterium]|nr:YceI family protein [Deltaproteobacteria bacterium]